MLSSNSILNPKSREISFIDSAYLGFSIFAQDNHAAGSFAQSISDIFSVFGAKCQLD